MNIEEKIHKYAGGSVESEESSEETQWFVRWAEQWQIEFNPENRRWRNWKDLKARKDMMNSWSEGNIQGFPNARVMSDSPLPIADVGF